MDNSVLQTIENRVSLWVYDDREISRKYWVTPSCGDESPHSG